ncbi:hypothetical protein ColLi_11438 [Colletotrichum liriopes]|uniref:Uncharacterized protein n=1 Tax=Colletotrichum liriopes TaxID=708192 RepID=A0AA37LX18_9PEZI|nr:hypothetical protein ColLi_11438 [Colletotrichum liriopes]
MESGTMGDDGGVETGDKGRGEGRGRRTTARRNQERQQAEAEWKRRAVERKAELGHVSCVISNPAAFAAAGADADVDAERGVELMRNDGGPGDVEVGSGEAPGMRKTSPYTF